MKLQLIVDTRERALHKYFAHHAFTEIKQLTHGDFNILVNDRLMATIERKTINDYAASIKDGRTANKSKLLSLRAKTGCQIYYIVEGHIGHTNPDTEFQNVKWSSIQHSMMHLRTEHYIFIERTSSAEDTVNFLIELCISFMRREGYSLELGFKISKCALDPVDFELPHVHPETDLSNRSPFETKYNIEKSTIGGDELLLTMKVEKSRHEQIVNIWQNIPGIGLQTAIELASRTMIIILTTDMSLFFKNNGQKLSKSACTIINKLRESAVNEEQRKYIAGFPNIGMKKSIQLLMNFGSLSNLVNALSANKDALSNISGFGKLTSNNFYDLIFL
jgi:ERCC4-type nuclease